MVCNSYISIIPHEIVEAEGRARQTSRMLFDLHQRIHSSIH